MPILDACIANIYEPGNIGADSGQTPVEPVIPSLVDPDDYDPDAIESYSLDFTKFYNSLYVGVF